MCIHQGSPARLCWPSFWQSCWNFAMWPVQRKSRRQKWILSFQLWSAKRWFISCWEAMEGNRPLSGSGFGWNNPFESHVQQPKIDRGSGKRKWNTERALTYHSSRHTSSELQETQWCYACLFGYIKLILIIISVFFLLFILCYIMLYIFEFWILFIIISSCVFWL